MPKSTSVTLDEHLVGFIDRQIAQGRYGSTSEVVRAALELLEEHEAKLEALRGALIEGEQSGPSEAFDFDAFIAAKRPADRQMPYVLSPRAQADLGEIWDHTLSRWGRQQAERYLRQIQAALELLSQNPRLGRSAGAIRRGYRKHPCGAHVIFYREIATGIDVVRILHQRMDVPRHL